MSQTNSNTNTGAGNTNRNQITEGDEQGQGDPSGRGRGGYRGNYRNNSIAIYLFEGRMKDGSFPNLLLPKPGIEPLNTKRLLIIPLYYAQIRTTEALMMYFITEST